MMRNRVSVLRRTAESGNRVRSRSWLRCRCRVGMDEAYPRSVDGPQRRLSSRSRREGLMRNPVNVLRRSC
jgi:hypothetical protein